jgi:hypothetical protein
MDNDEPLRIDMGGMRPDLAVTTFGRAHDQDVQLGGRD